tara:strand:- start:121 stop:522 length:402 start_codon:yes stop_codon:yes gene_type:complete
MHGTIKREKERIMIEALLVIGGIIIGGGTVALLKNDAPKDDKTSQTQQQVIKQLTDLDVIKELCTSEKVSNIEDRLLCRSMSCLVYSRGIDSQTSGKECEEISNLANAISIMEYCKDRFEDKTDCYDVFWRRK